MFTPEPAKYQLTEDLVNSAKQITLKQPRIEFKNKMIVGNVL